jgi:hypothetical protein
MRIDLTAGQRKQAEDLRAEGNAAFKGDCCLLGQLRTVEAGEVDAGAFALYCIPIPRTVADRIRKLIERERLKPALKMNLTRRGKEEQPLGCATCLAAQRRKT